MATKIKQQAPASVMTVKTNTFLGSAYAQIVGVVVTDTDITLEFAYFNPRPGNTEAQVVSRVTLPRRAGEGISNAILNAIREHEFKKKEENKNVHTAN